MSEMFYAVLLVSCVGLLGTWAIIRFALWLLDRRDNRRARWWQDKAVRCRHGSKRWSSIPCLGCSADFQAEVEREKAATNPTIIGVDLARGEDQTVVVERCGDRIRIIEPDPGVAKMRHERAMRDISKDRWAQRRTPARFDEYIQVPNRDAIKVEFDHEDFGKQVKEDLLGRRLIVYRAKLIGHLDGFELEAFIDVSEDECSLYPGGVAGNRMRALRTEVNMLGLALIRLAGR